MTGAMKKGVQRPGQSFYRFGAMGIFNLPSSERQPFLHEILERCRHSLAVLFSVITIWRQGLPVLASAHEPSDCSIKQFPNGGRIVLVMFEIRLHENTFGVAHGLNALRVVIGAHSACSDSQSHAICSNACWAGGPVEQYELQPLTHRTFMPVRGPVRRRSVPSRGRCQPRRVFLNDEFVSATSAVSFMAFL
jgi:hypothetical protein